jgi:hypothetical protein
MAGQGGQGGFESSGQLTRFAAVGNAKPEFISAKVSTPPVGQRSPAGWFRVLLGSPGC